MTSEQQEHSHILVIAHDEDHYKNLSQILGHYFSNKGQNQQQKNLCQHILLIVNKYYKAKVKLNYLSWSQALGFKQISQSHNYVKQSQQSTESNMQSNSIKVDLLVMLIHQSHDSLISYEYLDQIISNYNPEEFMILVDKKNPQQSWQHEQIIMQKCNNFIQIVKEDLHKINKLRPQWNHGSLLQMNQYGEGEEEEQLGIFSLLDRIQTTRWTTLVNVKKYDNNKQLKNDKTIQQPQQQNKGQSQNPEKLSNKNQSTQIIKNQQIDSQKDQQNTKNINVEKMSSEGQQQNQKDIQAQMMQFQSMMGEMLSFKNQATLMKDDQRKQKAEQLFGKIFKGMMNT